MSKGLRCNFLDILVVPLPLLGVLQSETVLKDSANSLQVHPLDVRVEEDDKEPSHEANAAVEAKSTARSDTLHHGKKCARDDDVSRPAGYRDEHGSQSADFEWDELGADPSNCCDSRGVECNVYDDCDKD